MASRKSDPEDKMLSEKLSEVMEDLGVSERLVAIRRRGMLLYEATMALIDGGRIFRIFGSQSEGTLTPGLKSDIDLLYNFSRQNLILNMSEWASGFPLTFLMIQNDTRLSPGYCYLQVISSDLPVLATVDDVCKDHFLSKDTVEDKTWGLLWKNTTILPVNSIPDSTMNGPAQTITIGGKQADSVFSLYCKATLPQVETWLQKQRKCTWPGKDVLDKCSTSGCFVVAVGSKVSPNPELEWRISTSLQERYLMFSLNTTQLHCYTLMKIILKTHINPYVEDVLTSFMCKNVLWFCITDSSYDWESDCLVPRLHVCLVRLKKYVEQNNCPHFIISENNLLAGKSSKTQRRKILNIMDNMLRNDEHMLFQTQIDDLGRRLQIKLGRLTHCSEIPSATDIAHAIVTINVSCLMEFNQFYHMFGIRNAETVKAYLVSILTDIQTYSSWGMNAYVHPYFDSEILLTACKLVKPFVSSTLGSVLSSKDIASNTSISDQAINYLDVGRYSDVLSGRLKHLSVLYCTGDVVRAGIELETILPVGKFTLPPCLYICSCIKKVYTSRNEANILQDYGNNCLDTIQSHSVVCTTFLPCEINCVPHELRYEILRSFIEEEKQMRTLRDTRWMDNIVVDSVPYLYFLQYKIYGRLKRRRQQEKNLTELSLVACILNLGHKETSLNLLGQCFEQERKPLTALWCYVESLKHRRRNNAATWLVCLLLFKLWKQQNMQ